MSKVIWLLLGVRSWLVGLGVWLVKLEYLILILVSYLSYALSYVLSYKRQNVLFIIILLSSSALGNSKEDPDENSS